MAHMLSRYTIERRDSKMTQDKVDMFVMTNQKYLPGEKVVFLKQKLLQADETKFQLASDRKSVV